MAQMISKKLKINHSNNIGKKFARLTVIAQKKYSKYIKYICNCECGITIEAYSAAVISGATTSCGCYYNESRHFKKSKPRSDIKYGTLSSAANKVWLSYRRNALSRGYSFEITKDQFMSIIVKNCFYCGAQARHLSKIKRKNIPSFSYNGLDRKDNKVGYAESNVVPCCFICNRAKGQLELIEFTSWIKDLINYRNILCE